MQGIKFLSGDAVLLSLRASLQANDWWVKLSVCVQTSRHHLALVLPSTLARSSRARLVPSDLIFAELSIMSLGLLSCFSVWRTKKWASVPDELNQHCCVASTEKRWCGWAGKGNEFQMIPVWRSQKSQRQSNRSCCLLENRKMSMFLAPCDVLRCDSSASPALSLQHLQNSGIKMQIDKREKERVSPEERTVCVSLSWWILEIQLVLSIRGMGKASWEGCQEENPLRIHVNNTTFTYVQINVWNLISSCAFGLQLGHLWPVSHTPKPQAREKEPFNHSSFLPPLPSPFQNENGM